jgi:peptide chain release factor 2
LWDDPEAAQALMRERTRLQNSLDVIDRIDQELNDNIELIELGESENDEQVISDAEKAIQDLHQFSQKQELETLLSGEADANDCYIEVHAGAGGTEAQDWAQILLRMYTRWAEKHDC